MIYSNVILLPTKRVIKYRGSCTQFSSQVLKIPLYISLILVIRSDRLRGRYFSLVSGSRPLQIEASLGLVFNGRFPYLEKEKYLSLTNGLGSPFFHTSVFVGHILSNIVLRAFCTPCTDRDFCFQIKQSVRLQL